MREDSFDVLFVVISQREDLRRFLENALPELAAACDSGTDDDLRWFPFDRMTDEELEQPD